MENQLGFRALSPMNLAAPLSLLCVAIQNTGIESLPLRMDVTLAHTGADSLHAEQDDSKKMKPVQGAFSRDRKLR
jgi:hypothetical protein